MFTTKHYGRTRSRLAASSAAVLLLISVLLAGCGSGSADSTVSPTGSPEASDSTTTAPSDTTTTAAGEADEGESSDDIESDADAPTGGVGVMMGSADIVELGGFDFNDKTVDPFSIAGAQVLNCEPTSNPDESLFVQIRGEGTGISFNVIKGSLTTHLIQAYEEGIGLFKASASSQATFSGNDTRWFQTVDGSLTEIDEPLMQVADGRLSGMATLYVDGGNASRTISFDVAIPTERLPTDACRFS